MATRISRITSRVEPRVKIYLTNAARAAKMPLTRFLIESAYSRIEYMIITGAWKAKSPPPLRDHRRKVKS